MSYLVFGMLSYCMCRLKSVSMQKERELERVKKSSAENSGDHGIMTPKPFTYIPTTFTVKDMVAIEL